MKHKRLTILFTLLLFTLAAGAQEKHLVRLGWGDSRFEKLAFHVGDGKENFAYTGHFFTDYQYYFTNVTSVGIQADFQAICWTQKKQRQRTFDITLMPTVRFTWMHSSWARLYSGLGAGVLFTFDNDGDHAFAPAFNLSPIGLQLGKTHWCGSIDLGFMAAFNNLNRVYMMGSRLVSVSVNYRW